MKKTEKVLVQKRSVDIALKLLTLFSATYIVNCSHDQNQATFKGGEL
jgi:hypothetical protein